MLTYIAVLTGKAYSSVTVIVTLFDLCDWNHSNVRIKTLYRMCWLLRDAVLAININEDDYLIEFS